MKSLGKQTVLLEHPPVILSGGNIGGKKESQGPMAPFFDQLSQDDHFGQASWEKAESEMQRQALASALAKAGLSASQLSCILAGDLLNQCISSSFAARGQAVPFLGLYGACSTMGESIMLGAMLLDGGLGQCMAAVTSSHFCSAERQYRTPLQYGAQRTPTAQWTATASGAVILGREGIGPKITHATMGKIVDKGITDANNMGAAMAPAAYDTIATHFQDTGRTPKDYDLIVTGDLGQLGSNILEDWFQRDGVTLHNHADCGLLLFDRKKQDVHAGASGCGCAAGVFTGYLLQGLQAGRWKRILFCPTGALLSPTSAMQKESIPAICHAVAIQAHGG